MRTVTCSWFLAIVVSAAGLPHLQPRWSSSHFWESPSGQGSYLDFGKRGAEEQNCDLTQASMPTAPTPLPSPAAGLTISHVAIGRGTQNYTCDLSNSTAVPVNIGAVAELFNVSCIAATTPSLLDRIPSIALDLSIPSTDDPESPAATDLSGYHYFLNETTPFFNLDTPSHSYGNGAFKKVNSTSAPTSAMKGPGDSGDGAVAWLKLSARNPSGQVLQEVYRVNTAGGSPPKTCQGQQASFEVQYAAEYWVYESS